MAAGWKAERTRRNIRLLNPVDTRWRVKTIYLVFQASQLKSFLTLTSTESSRLNQYWACTRKGWRHYRENNSQDEYKLQALGLFFHDRLGNTTLHNFHKGKEWRSSWRAFAAIKRPDNFANTILGRVFIF